MTELNNNHLFNKDLNELNLMKAHLAQALEIAERLTKKLSKVTPDTPYQRKKKEHQLVMANWMARYKQKQEAKYGKWGQAAQIKSK